MKIIQRNLFLLLCFTLFSTWGADVGQWRVAIPEDFQGPIVNQQNQAKSVMFIKGFGTEKYQQISFTGKNLKKSLTDNDKKELLIYAVEAFQKKKPQFTFSKPEWLTIDGQLVSKIAFVELSGKRERAKGDFYAMIKDKELLIVTVISTALKAQANFQALQNAVEKMTGIKGAKSLADSDLITTKQLYGLSDIQLELPAGFLLVAEDNGNNSFTKIWLRGKTRLLINYNNWVAVPPKHSIPEILQKISQKNSVAKKLHPQAELLEKAKVISVGKQKILKEAWQNSQTQERGVSYSFFLGKKMVTIEVYDMGNSLEASAFAGVFPPFDDYKITNQAVLKFIENLPIASSSEEKSTDGMKTITY